MSASARTLRLRLLELRQAAGLTQREVADAIGTTRERVGYLESGITRRVELDTLEQLSRLFGVPVGELFAEAAGELASSRDARQVQAARKPGRPPTRTDRRA